MDAEVHLDAQATSTADSEVSTSSSEALAPCTPTKTEDECPGEEPRPADGPCCLDERLEPHILFALQVSQSLVKG
jgi:hypothetical protein